MLDESPGSGRFSVNKFAVYLLPHNLCLMQPTSLHLTDELHLIETTSAPVNSETTPKIPV